MKIRLINRNNITRAAIGLAILGLSSTALLAQGPVGIFPWWEGSIATELNLTDAQRQQVETVQRDYRGKMIDGRADMAKAELNLEDTMNADPFDLRKATDAANKVADARNELTRNLSQMGLKMRAVLTKEQWQKTRARAQRPGFPGGRGGGPGRPGFQDGRPPQDGSSPPPTGRGPDRGRNRSGGGPNGPPPPENRF